MLVLLPLFKLVSFQLLLLPLPEVVVATTSGGSLISMDEHVQLPAATQLNELGPATVTSSSFELNDQIIKTQVEKLQDSRQVAERQNDSNSGYDDLGSSQHYQSEPLTRNSRRRDDDSSGSDFFQLFDELFMAQKVGLKLLSGHYTSATPNTNRQRQNFSGTRYPQTVTGLSSLPQSPPQRLKPADVGSNNRIWRPDAFNQVPFQQQPQQQQFQLMKHQSYASSQLQSLIQAINEWLARKCSSINAAFVLITSSLMQKSSPPRPSFMSLTQKQSPGPSSNARNWREKSSLSDFDGELSQLSQVATAMLRSNKTTTATTVGNNNQEHVTKVATTTTNVPKSAAKVSLLIQKQDKQQQASNRVLKKRSLMVAQDPQRNMQLQASAASGSQPQAFIDCMPTSDAGGNVDQLGCKQVEAQVGQSLAYNMPSSLRQIQDICGSINKLFKFCWHASSQRQLLAASGASLGDKFQSVSGSSQDFSQTSAGSLSAASSLSTQQQQQRYQSQVNMTRQQQLQGCERTAPKLSENIQSRIFWVQNNLCSDSEFQKEFIDNAQCLSRWSKKHAERVCWKEYTLIQQKIIQPNIQQKQQQQQQLHQPVRQLDDFSGNLPARAGSQSESWSRSGGPWKRDSGTPHWDDDVDVDKEFKTLCCLFDLFLRCVSRQATADCGRSASQFVVKFLSKIGSEDVRYLCNSRVASNYNSSSYSPPSLLSSAVAIENQFIDEMYCRDPAIYASIESAMTRYNYGPSPGQDSIKFPDNDIGSILYGPDMMPGNGSSESLVSSLCYIALVCVLFLSILDAVY